jgi:hypothetical protein
MEVSQALLSVACSPFKSHPSHFLKSDVPVQKMSSITSPIMEHNQLSLAESDSQINNLITSMKAFEEEAKIISANFNDVVSATSNVFSAAEILTAEYLEVMLGSAQGLHESIDTVLNHTNVFVAKCHQLESTLSMIDRLEDQV